MSKPEIEEFAEDLSSRIQSDPHSLSDGSLTGKNGYPKKALKLEQTTLPAGWKICRSTKRLRTGGIILSLVLRKRNIYLLPDIKALPLRLDGGNG
ncbi:MAG: hypothetical protein V8S14_06140 [Lachnospiraceae bacterium]